MPKLYSSKEIESVLKKLKFSFVKQKGSHGKFKNVYGKIVILPMNKKEIPSGTFSSLLRQMEINADEFRKLLKH